MKLRAVSGIVLTLLLTSMLTLTLSIQPVKAEPKTWIVDDDGPADFNKIQSAINAANQRDTIYVYNGTYYENVVVNKTVSLFGENKETTIIDANRTGHVVYITADNVTISGFTMQNGGQGIWLHHSNGNIISGNIMSNNLFGFGEYVSSGIFMDFSDCNTIRNNEISNNMEGIAMLEECHKNIMNGNNITNNYGSGIGPSQGSDYNIIDNNTVTSNGCGICLAFSSNNNSIINNIISSNTQGIFVCARCDYNEIIGNDITSNSLGIHIGIDSRYQIIKDNIISKNHCGINITESYANIIYHNNFINNTNQAYTRANVGSRVNTWDNGYPSGGNYWSNYTGIDVKSGPNQDQPGSDGVGDTAYVIDVDNRDRYPLMYPLGTPPSPSYTLAIHSSLTGVTFTVDGVSRTTPRSVAYSEGSSVSLVMPESHGGYVWSYWLEDGDTNRIKTVTVSTNTTLTAVYTRLRPVGGKATPITIPINKPEPTTLWTWLTILLPLAATTIFLKLKKKKQ